MKHSNVRRAGTIGLFGASLALAGQAIAASTGSLTISKIVVNTTTASLPAGYAMAISCIPRPPLHTTLHASRTVVVGHQELVPAIPGGSICSAQESPPPVPGRILGCAPGTAGWRTTYAPQTTIVQAGRTAHITVTNTLSCRQTGAADLKINKIVDDKTGGTLNLPASFPITLTCPGPPGFSRTVSVPANGGNGISNIPAPATCTISETLTAIPHARGCHDAARIGP